MKQPEIQIPSYLTQDYMVEMVFDYYLQPEIQFAIYDRLSKEVSYHPELKLENGQILRPLQLDLVKQGKVLLPSSAEVYITEAGLLEKIKTFINEYLDLPHPFYLELVSHYVLLTWVYDKLSVVPYLRALGDYGSGKTRFAQVVGSICYRPLFLAGATSDAFIFRMIELFKGTMVINELERINSDLQSQIIVILNNGYEKGLYVGRVEGDRKKEPKVFDVYSPKIITSRRKFKDPALESRILSIPMRPTKRTDIPIILNDLFWDKAQKLRNKLLMYRFENYFIPEFEDKESKLSGLEPRLKQTLLPLLYVIHDEEVEKRFIEFAREFQENVVSDRSFEIEALIAEKIIELFSEKEKITVGDVKEKVNSELDEKEKLTSRSVGQKIRESGFRTKKTHGNYQVIFNRTTIDYLKDRYGPREETIDQSPPSLPSPPESLNSRVDVVDKVENGREVIKE